jgi:hypothetical protein
MTKIITCAELRHRRLEELQALFRSLEIELLRTEPSSFERTTALASLGKRQPRHGDMPGPAGATASDALDGLVTLCRSRGNPPRDRYVIFSAGAAATRRWIKERLRRPALSRIPRMILPARSLRVFSECVPSSRRTCPLP